MAYADNTSLLSVIVPVYNAAATLKATIDSVIAAEIDDMEIILVDDGSTDSSSTICDEYAKEHANISVIHQPNSGPSVSRNAGMASAHGRYYFFLDGDDTVHKELFKRFVTYQNEHLNLPDIILVNAQKVHAVTGKILPIGAPITSEMVNDLDGVAVVKNILKTDPRYEWYAWRYFYSSEYLKKKRFQFVADKYYEDVEWTPRVLLGAASLGYIDIVGVNYLYQNATSILNTPSLKKSQDKVEISVRMVDYTDQNITDKQLNSLLKSNFSNLFLSAFGDYLNGSNELYSLLYKNRALLRYEKSRFGIFAHFACSFFGFRLGCVLLKKIKRLL